MTHNYREEASASLERAKVLLQSECNYSLRYAALELRLSIEAITYDRAQAYIDVLPPIHYETWQPKLLLKVLLELEPLADTGAKVWFINSEDQTLNELGEETVFTLKDISKSSYDSLGSFLHYPTLKQIQDGSVKFDRLRKRCLDIVGKLEAALKSKVFNVVPQNIVNFECEDCGKPVLKHIKKLGDRPNVTCFSCDAEYVLDPVEDGLYLPIRREAKIVCRNSSCEHEFQIGIEKFKVGNLINCPSCGREYQMRICLIEQTALVN